VLTALSGQSLPRLQRLSENLWLFRDTANVYVVRRGSRCLLVDFGAGDVLDQLTELGIGAVDWILHTHHHRDQAQGDERAVERGVSIAVPAHERHLFESAELFWANRRVFHMYDVQNNLDARIRDIPVAESLRDGQRFVWSDLTFEVVPTPGHTPGSISLLANIDDQMVVFTGDLMYAPGKVLTLHDLQYEYGGIEGVDLSAYSLKRLAALKPDLVCPSHGEVLSEPVAAIEQTCDRLVGYLHALGATAILDNRPYAFSPHLIVSHQTVSTFYAIRSDSGRALLIDYGAASSTAMWGMERATGPTGRLRFLEHTIDTLKADFGVESIDVAIPSHVHDDHVLGFPHLKASYGTEIWALDLMKPVLEGPRDYLLGCVLAERIDVDRSLTSGQHFAWQEFEFEILHSPGHTEYQMALHAELDGQRIAFTGDAIFPPDAQFAPHRNLLFRNQFEAHSHLLAIDNLIAHSPDVVCPGHWEPFARDDSYLAQTRAVAAALPKYFGDLLPEGLMGRGIDPSWVRISPAQPVVQVGAALDLTVHVTNHEDAARTFEVSLVCPPGLVVTPAIAQLALEAGQAGEILYAVTVPPAWKPRMDRFAIAADVTVDGWRLGQVCACICEIYGSPPNNQSWA
jgi:glyoxylase-like metal-dependent hydrolase (beta-lactamase superfamily II)